MRKRRDFPVTLADGLSLADSLNARHQIAFKESTKSGPAPFQRLYVMRSDGTDRHPVFDEATHSLNCSPAWSPDGRTLYHSHDQIFAVDVVTATAYPLTDFPEGEHANWLLSRSPEGCTLAFLDFPPPTAEGRPSPHRLCTVGTDGRGLRVVLDRPEGYGIWQADVCWHTRQGIVTAVVPGQGTGVWRVSLDGGEAVRIGVAPVGTCGFAVSPDGRLIAYTDLVSGGIYVLPTDGGAARQITRSGSNPSWSPDGQQIAFMQGDYELWMVGVVDRHFQKLAWFGGRNFPLSRRGGSYAHAPLWSSDGRLLWFGLTKTGRLRTIKNPEFLQRLREQIIGGKGHYAGMTQAQRERVIQDATDRQYWDFVHKHGIIDFAENKVWIEDGYWTNVALASAGLS